jgi:hypothetical protein
VTKPVNESVNEASRGFRPTRRFRFIREVAVGVTATVLAAILIWVMGIGGSANSRDQPTKNHADSTEMTRKSSPPERSRLTRELYASIEPGMSLWQLSDALGSPHMKQKFFDDESAEAVQLYRDVGVYFRSGSDAENSADSGGDAPKFEEAVWESDKQVMGPYGPTSQHIAVLLQDGKVVAKREAGVE